MEAISQRASLILRSPFAKIRDSCDGDVYLKESSIHGNGVFSKTNFLKGDMITIFPPHYLFVLPNGRNHTPRDKQIGIMNSDLTEGKELSENIMTRYSCQIDEYISICGDPDLVDNQLMLGHMINDGIKSELIERLDKKSYNDISERVNNVMFVLRDNTMIAVATKDIPKDKELLVSYGYEYWLSNSD